ncbi:LysR family transcriptional regulator [Actinomadura parmotrematis]|uniref:LysR family transcriptional regulator n=1 Tax=Actinomadura parmotrematis TaxID=2864039 RepID=A0ABS7G173_9ACTN|nr:LysR family transcriptional regulator [Actinomadura parmotrematis]MBW8485619.1 LysR family transcriptional regulator [Actinomadura parmotrematis]
MSEFTVLGLRVVREAARLGSFSLAAEHLGYTQSAVSRQIALMEQAAGRPLFERQARGVRATEAGRLVVRHAEAVLGELRTARQGLADLDGRPPGRLRVGAVATAMAALVPRAIATLAEREPGTEVPLREGPTIRLLAALAGGRLDLAVVPPPARPPAGVSLAPLLDDPLLVAVALDHPLAGAGAVRPAELRAERWITGSTDPGTTLLGAWTGGEWEPRVAFTARDWVAKLGLAAAGLGVTVVPGLAVPALPPTVAVVRIDDPLAVRPLAAARRADAPEDPRGRAFTEMLLDAAADLSAELRRRLRP